MDDTYQTDKDTALALGELLAAHRGEEIAVLDLRRLAAWTDFFVIATVSSGTHLSGLQRHIRDFCRERGVEILRRSSARDEDEWCLIDMGAIVVHLMSRKARGFYELERLWGSGDTLTPAPKPG
jgi:ribosome-associated protein